MAPSLHSKAFSQSRRTGSIAGYRSCRSLAIWRGTSPEIFSDVGFAWATPISTEAVDPRVGVKRHRVRSHHEDVSGAIARKFFPKISLIAKSAKCRVSGMSTTFGQYIRSLREGKRLTQRALSQAVGFKSLAHLSDIESGKRNPAKETLPKFAKALGVAVSELESRDMRGPIDAAKVLFARKPEMVGAFLKIIEAAKKMDAEELVARVTRESRQPEVCVRPVEVPAAPRSAPVVRAGIPKAELGKNPTAQPTLF